METFEIIITGLGGEKHAVKTLMFTKERMQYCSSGDGSREAV